MRKRTHLIHREQSKSDGSTTSNGICCPVLFSLVSTVSINNKKKVIKQNYTSAMLSHVFSMYQQHLIFRCVFYILATYSTMKHHYSNFYAKLQIQPWHKSAHLSLILVTLYPLTEGSIWPCISNQCQNTFC